MVATPLNPSGSGPLFPILCPICGALLGAYYRDGFSLKASSKPCSGQCQRLWLFGHRRRKWRTVPPELRKLQLAAEMLEDEAR